MTVERRRLYLAFVGDGSDTAELRADLAARLQVYWASSSFGG